MNMLCQGAQQLGVRFVNFGIYHQFRALFWTEGK